MIIVTAAFEGRTPAGVLPVRRELLDRVVAVLRAYRGRSLAEVAEAEIPGR